MELVTKMQAIIIFTCFALFSIVVALPTAESNSNDSLAIQPRIIDGGNVNKINYYEVAIVSDANSPPIKLCSGVLIKTEWVLTSAYCVQGHQILRVVLGSPYVDPTGLGQQGKLVDQILRHPYYNAAYMLHDIALLYVKSALNVDSVTLAALPPVPVFANEYVGQIGTISGYGRQGNGISSNFMYLSSKQVQIIDNVHCTQEGHFMNNYKICSAGRAVCEGDQGGPLIIGNTVVGLASAALKALNCEGQVSTTYTRVNYYRQWIDQTICTWCKC